MTWERPEEFIEVGKIYNYPLAGCIVKRIHILAEINDDGYRLIVYKRWSSTKHYYWYQIEPREHLDWFAERGRITKLR